MLLAFVIKIGGEKKYASKGAEQEEHTKAQDPWGIYTILTSVSGIKK